MHLLCGLRRTGSAQCLSDLRRRFSTPSHTATRRAPRRQDIGIGQPTGQHAACAFKMECCTGGRIDRAPGRYPGPGALAFRSNAAGNSFAAQKQACHKATVRPGRRTRYSVARAERGRAWVDGGFLRGRDPPFLLGAWRAARRSGCRTAHVVFHLDPGGRSIHAYSLRAEDQPMRSIASCMGRAGLGGITSPASAGTTLRIMTGAGTASISRSRRCPTTGQPPTMPFLSAVTSLSCACNHPPERRPTASSIPSLSAASVAR